MLIESKKIIDNPYSIKKLKHTKNLIDLKLVLFKINKLNIIEIEERILRIFYREN